VLFSGGLASFETARRVLQKYKKENVELWFFDTLIEDEDLYRFLNETEDVLGIKIKKLRDGRNPWQVFFDRRYIGNSRVDLCSRILKRELLEKKLRKINNEFEITLYFGLEWHETHRMEVVKPRWEDSGIKVEFPLTWKPLISFEDFRQILVNLGIKIPRLYTLGFNHNNCGGACIKAGFKQWALLYYTFPDRYMWHEKKELEFRKKIGKDVSILRDRKNGSTKPLTLRAFRKRLCTTNEINGSLKKYIDSLEYDSPCSCFFNSSNKF
jgi:hypothetical protein